jgi:CO/xanthine dehydrogenase FAD-binding subunit
MIPVAFDYTRPSTVDEALAMLEKKATSLFAPGSN